MPSLSNDIPKYPVKKKETREDRARKKKLKKAAIAKKLRKSEKMDNASVKDINDRINRADAEGKKALVKRLEKHRDNVMKGRKSSVPTNK